MFLTDSEVQFLKKTECKDLLSGVSNVKHRLIILLMLDAGLRVSECVGLHLYDFDFKQRKLKVESLKKREKKKTRAIPISGRLYTALADYLYKHKLQQEDFLFPSNNSESGHLSRFAVNKFLASYKDRLGIKELYPHILRHTCATSHLASGANIVEIKEMLGHERLETTTIYTHIPTEVLRANVERATADKATIWEKIKRYLFKKEPDKLISISLKNNLLIGRETEAERVKSFVNRDINTIILGGIGVGKSQLINALEFDKPVLRLEDSDNFKKSLIHILLYLFKNDKEQVFSLLYADYDLEAVQVKLNRESVGNLIDEIKKLVEPKEFVLIIDNVDRITPKTTKALEMLKDTFTILTSAREVPINKSSFVWNFEVIQLKELERKHALNLIQKLSYDLDIEDYELFRNHIFEQSNGNPRVIYEVIERYRKEPIITSEVVREIRHTGSLRELDMSGLVMVFIAALAILRYLSREVDNDSFRFIGGAAMVSLILFRYFFRYTKRKFV